MNENTISLLKSCNQGCKYATNSIEKLYPHIKDDRFRQLIGDYNNKHIKLGDECHVLLNKYGADEKDPNPMATMFSNMSINMKMINDDSTEKIAELMYDGCHMGIKSVSQDLNKYSDAAQESRNLAKELIDIEENYMKDLLGYL